MEESTLWGVGLVAAPDLGAAEQAVRRLFPTGRVERVTSARVPHLVVRVPLSSVEDWAGVRTVFGRLTAASEWLVLVVGPRDRGDDVERRRARAQALLGLAANLPAPRRPLDMDELLVYDVLVGARSPAQAAVVRDVLGPVLRQPGESGRRLLATLDTLHWHNGSAKSAARSLGVHVKTVHNRLRRIEELTGLCLDHPPDRMRIEVALYLLRAMEAGLATESRVDGPVGSPSFRSRTPR